VADPTAQETTAPGAEVPRGLRVVAGWSWRILVVLGLVVACITVIVRLEVLFVALFVALLATALLQPGMDLLRRAGLPQALAAAVTLIGALAVVGVVFYLTGRALAGQAGELSAAVADGFNQLKLWIEDTFGLSAEQLGEYTTRLWESLRENAGSIGSGVFGAASTAGEFLAGAGVALFATIFFLYDGPGIWRWVGSLFPAGPRAHVDQAGALSWQALSGYARGTVLIAAIDAIGIGVGVALLGVPLAGPIAVLVFFGSFIPIVGATLSGLVAVLVALATKGLTTAVLTLGVVLLVQQLEGHVLQPLIQGRFVAIHPLAVVLAVAAGSVTAGLVGAVIAVPIVATANVLVRYAAGVARGDGEPPGLALESAP
jgi:predicted PurR-regulated permease PerM